MTAINLTPPPENQPLVSVWALAYNHAKYIARALDSILMQTTDFPIEIVVHDDCSTDGTTEIIKDYAARYPDIIHPIYESVNQYTTHPNAFELYGEYINKFCRGKYIAMLECDDYWTDPLKLQKQAGFMERHEEVGFVGSYFDLQDMNKEGTTMVRDELGVRWWDKVEKREYIDEEGNKWFICGNIFKQVQYTLACWTLTIMYRKRLIENLPYLNTQDLVLHGILAKNADFAMLACSTGVYVRGTESSISFSKKEKINANHIKWLVNVWRSYAILYPDEHYYTPEVINDNQYIHAMKQAILDGDYETAALAKSRLLTPQFRNSFFSRLMIGPISMRLLKPVMKLYVRLKKKEEFRV